MREFIQYHRRMFALMCGTSLVAAVGLAIGMQPDWAWAGGFAAGAIAQLFKFGFLDIAAVKKIATEKEAAASTQLKSMFLSLVVFGLAVVVVFKLRLNVWAMAAGIFLPRIILLIDAYIRPNPFTGTTGIDDADPGKVPEVNEGQEGNAQADAALSPQSGDEGKSGVLH